MGALPKRLLQAAAIGLLGLLVLLFALGLHQSSSSVAAELRDGRAPTAPSFTLPRLNGGDASLSQFRGKIVLLNFWASWCVSCRDEAPYFNRIASTLGRRGVAVVGVDSQDFVADARRFARTYDIRYTLLHESGSEIADRWGVTSGFPVTFVIDRRGRVRRFFDGAVTAEDLHRALAPLLERPV